MHIAICDDNVADRKHLERLLSRESDKRAGTPNILYVDSFGDKEKFLYNPLKYDLIFMDMVKTPTIAEEIVKELTAMDFTAPLVMYSSIYDYAANPNLPDYIIHMKKPYLPEPLEELLKLGDKHVLGHVETVELHCPNILHEVAITDIFYCLISDAHTLLYLKNGDFIEIGESISDLSTLLSPYHEFYRIQKNVIVNMKYVTLLTPFSVMMQDYKEFRSSPLRYRDLKELKETVDAW